MCVTTLNLLRTRVRIIPEPADAAQYFVPPGAAGAPAEGTVGHHKPSLSRQSLAEFTTASSALDSCVYSMAYGS